MRSRTDNAMREALGDFLGILEYKARHGVMSRIANPIPEGTTGTLPVRFTLNGSTRELTFFGGNPVTAADLAGTGVIEVWYDWFYGIFELNSALPPTA